MKTTTTRARRWTLARRISDYLIPQYIPGRHHNLDNSLVALLTARDTRP